MKKTAIAMRELNLEEVEAVAGGALNEWQNAGIAVMGLGLAGGPVTTAFAVPISFAMFGLGTYRKIMSH
jgi:hypothetical protein